MGQVNRYSTIVVWVKVGLPLVALALLSTLFLFSRAPDPDAALPFADIDVEQVAREQRLSQPQFAGTLTDGRQIVLVSETAMPMPGEPNRIHLEAIAADLELSAQTDARLVANEGDIDMASQIAVLAGEVSVSTTQGYRLDSDTLTISMSEMQVVSPGAVRVVGPRLRLTAGAMEFSGPDTAAMLRFTDGVRLVYGANAGDGDDDE